MATHDKADAAAAHDLAGQVAENVARNVSGQVAVPATSAPGARLMAGSRNHSLLAGPAGLLLARPWLDRAALLGLKHVYFPLSRLWAAARAAHGDRDAFFAAIPLPRRLEHSERLASALGKFEEARAAVNGIEAEWERVFFGHEDQPESYRVAVETARLNRRHAYNATRRHFAFLLPQNIPRVKLEIDPPEAVRGVYGPALADRRPYVAVPDPMPVVEASRTVLGANGRESWVRFASPSPRLADTVYARVYEPDGVKNPPTLILGHGVCVEFDHWHGLIDETQALVAAGIRVIRPEAPWHGRRVSPGHFGGERIIGQVPTGALDAFLGAMREWAVLADYAKRTSSGPLLIGGTSLGALFAQLAADCAHDWPDAIKPQAMLLITHTGHMSDAMLGGALTDLVGQASQIEAAGWTPAVVTPYLRLIDPERPPVMAASRIVSVQGSRDAVTPFPGGDALVKRWALPAANMFVSDRGHFTVPMGLKRNRAPVERFIEIVRSLR